GRKMDFLHIILKRPATGTAGRTLSTNVVYSIISFDMSSPLTLARVFAARQAIGGVAVRTPTIRSDSLSARFMHDVWLKLETLQPIGTFKIRGAANALAQRP